MIELLSTYKMQLNIVGSILLILSGIVYWFGRYSFDVTDQEVLVRQSKQASWVWLLVIILFIIGLMSRAGLLVVLIASLLFTLYEINNFRSVQGSTAVRICLILRSILTFGAGVFILAAWWSHRYYAT